MVNRVWILIGKKVSGEATRQELEELDCLMADGAEDAYTVSQLEQLWINSKSDSAEQSQYKIDSRWRRFKMKLSDDKRTSKFSLMPLSRRWLVAASCAFLILAAGIAQLTGNYNIYNGLNTTIEAPEGETSEVKLPDGSKVWLNANSKLTYKKQFGEKFREVSLVGEAFFDVIKDANHPFIVNTASLHLKVLGTAFNVRAFTNDKTSEAALVRGSIEVTLVNNPDKKITLKPTEKITVRNVGVAAAKPAATTDAVVKQIPLITLSNIHYKESETLPEEVQWIEKKLVFNSEQFDDLAARMERYYNVSIEFNDEAAKNLVFSGSFKEENINDAMKALQATGNFQYKTANNKITIYK